MQDRRPSDRYKYKLMKVLFIVYHPVDPYITFSSAESIKKNGGECFYLIVEKEGIIKKIIDLKGYESKVIGISKTSFVGKLLNTVKVVNAIRKVHKLYQPDLVFSPAAPYTSLALKKFKTPLICWEDTETATFNYKYSIGRIDCLLLTESFYLKIDQKKVIRFNGYKELAYLHPTVFHPDENVLKELGLSKSDNIILMRFSALNAMHDIGLKSEALHHDDEILAFIEKLENNFNAKIFISVTERNLDERFDKYKLSIEPDKYVHLLSFCSLYFGEGTTTASEAGVLGVPWINIQQTERGYLIDQENNFGLGFRTNNIELGMRKAEEILRMENFREDWQIKRLRLLESKINVSKFLPWFLENYPESADEMKKNVKYQEIF